MIAYWRNEAVLDFVDLKTTRFERVINAGVIGKCAINNPPEKCVRHRNIIPFCILVNSLNHLFDYSMRGKIIKTLSNVRLIDKSGSSDYPFLGNQGKNSLVVSTYS